MWPIFEFLLTFLPKSVMMEETAEQIVVVEVLLSLKWKRFSDEELVLQIQKGEGEAFAELASRYLPLIHHTAVPYRSSLLETEDLSQEGLIGLFFAAGTYQEGRAAFSTYAGACISNRIISAGRKALARKNEPLRGAVSLDAEEIGNVYAEPVSGPSEDPEALLIHRESLDLLLNIIQEALTEMERQTLVCYVSGFSYEEISDKLGISIKAVENALQRARRKLSAAF